MAGLPFDRVTLAGARARIVAMAGRRDRPRQVCTGNLDHVHLAQRDGAFRAAYEGADLVVADGAPIVWLSRLSAGAGSPVSPQQPLPERVAGSDLFWELARASSEQNLRLFFLGGAPGSAGRAAIAAERRFPGTCIVGTYCPPHATFETHEEQRRIEGIVRAARPDVLLVGLGAPKQEIWIAERKGALGVPVAIGVGGSFEMAAGTRKRAPVALQRAGLEWLYRFAQEPVRLFERYFIHDLPTLVRLTAAALRARLLPPTLPLG